MGQVKESTKVWADPGVLLAYFLVSSGRVQSQSYAFQGINVIGASLLVAYSILLSAWAAVALNLA